VNDRQLGERLRRAFEAEQPPAVSAAEILRRAEATQSTGHHADLQAREPTHPHPGRPVVMPSEGQQPLGAVAFDREGRQRRELEQIRRSFTQIGTRMGSLFEPAQEREAQQAEHQQPAEPGTRTVEAPPAGRRVPSWRVPAVVVLALLCLLVGGGLGFLLRGPAPAPVTIPTVVTRTVVRTETKPVAPPACLATAQRGDEVIDLLVRNIRDRRLTIALKAYTTASQACRREASP
jgi:hypothetical protein